MNSVEPTQTSYAVQEGSSKVASSTANPRMGVGSTHNGQCCLEHLRTQLLHDLVEIVAVNENGSSRGFAGLEIPGGWPRDLNPRKESRNELLNRSGLSELT